MSAARRPLRGWTLALLWAIAGCRGPGLLEREPSELPSAERPLVVALEGDLGLSREALIEAARRDLEEFEAHGWRASFVDDAAFAAQRALEDAGFLDARVEARVEQADAGRRVVLDLAAGPRTALAALQLVGAEAFPKDQVRALFEFPRAEPGAKPGAATEFWYSTRALKRGTQRLESAYRRAGYRDVLVSGFEQRLDAEPETGRIARVVVEPGRRQVLHQLALEFGPEDPPAEVDFESFGLAYRGRPHTARLESELRAALRQAMADAGYIDADVRGPLEVREEQDAPDATGTAAVTLRFLLSPGPRVRISELRFEPLTLDEEGELRPLKSSEGFVRRRLKLGPGDLASDAQREASFQSLYATGLFQRAELEFIGEGPERELLVRLEELPSQELFVEPGFGTYEGLRVRAGWRERNLFGTGRTLRAQGLAAQRARRVELGLTDPNLFGERISGDLSVRYDEREWPAFTRRESGARFVASRALDSELQLSLSYDWRRSDVVDATLDPSLDPDLAEALETVDISSILIGPRYDTRDRLFVPLRGAFLRFGIEWASSLLGSEIDYLKPTLTGTVFLPLNPERSEVIAASFQAGAIQPLGSTEVIPLSERFFLGGATTVRAFRENELGPEGEPGSGTGGEAYGLFSIEYRRAVAGGLHAGLFYDAGAVLPQASDLRDPSALRGGPGLGLRYLLPVGPLRLDVAHNVDARSDEPDFVLHVAVGMSF